jgi:hypothetical protein
MPYKDPKRQAEASHRSYLKNRTIYRERQREARKQPGARDEEYAKRKRGVRDRAAEYEARRAARQATKRPALAPEPKAPSRPRRESDLERELTAQQRRLKEEALRRLGVVADEETR